MLKQLLLIGPMSHLGGGEAAAFQEVVATMARIRYLNVHLLQKMSLSQSASARILNALRVLMAVVRHLKRGLNGIYLSCGQSLGGVLRDCIIIALAKAAGVPVMIHLHGARLKVLYGSMVWPLNWVLKKAYGMSESIVVLGPSLRNQFFFLGDRKGFHVVPNSYGNDFPSERIRGRRSGKRMKILFLSNVLPSKGLFDLLDSCVILKKEAIPFEVHFAGELIPEGSQGLSQLRMRIDRFKDLLGNGEFSVHGHVSGPKKWALLRSSHVFVLPSSYPLEGQPISIIEAMRSGCCIVTTNQGGIGDLVKDGRNGFIIKQGDVSAIASRLKWLWTHPGTMRAIEKRNMKEALEKYSPELFSSRMEKIFADTFGISTIHKN